MFQPFFLVDGRSVLVLFHFLLPSVWHHLWRVVLVEVV